MNGCIEAGVEPSDRAPAAGRAENNFDIVRLILALLVYFGHYNWVLPNDDLPTHLLSFVAGEDGQRAVQVFFVMSGFLMFQSFARSPDFWSFIEKRARRIYPAYLTVVLCCTILGIWFSWMPVSEYFSVNLVKYILANATFLNFLHPTLPGVFDKNPIHYVNASLWTLKIEVTYYLLFPVIYRIGRQIGFLVFFTFLYSFSIAYHSIMVGLRDTSGMHIYDVLAAQLPGQLAYFMAGALLASWRAPNITRSALLAGVAAGLAAVGYAGVVSFCYPLVEAAIVLAFCLHGPKLGRWVKFEDCSYGIYIIHFPVLQAARSAGFMQERPWTRFGFLTLLIVVLASMMWRFIERPTLARRWVKRRPALGAPST